MFHRWHFFPLLVPSSNMPIFSGFLFCLTFELLKTCQNLKSFCYSFVILIIFQLLLLTLFSIGIFLAAYGWWWEGGGGGGGQKGLHLNLSHISNNYEFWHRYTLPKEESKNIWLTWHPLSSADISIFSPEIRKFCYIREYRYILHFDT